MSAAEPAAVSPAFPSQLFDVAGRVEARVDALLGFEIERWQSIADEVVEPLESLRDLVRAGGKRLRPAFCFVAYVGAGGDPGATQILDAAAALELVHTFALVHDDVMDGSDQRRGQDTVHRRFSGEHRRAEWHGEARRFGEGMAILVGDFAAVYADRLIRSAPPRAQAVFDELRIELCIGQTLDLIGTARPGTDRDAARRITRFKSAKYTVERPLHLGAALADRFDELAEPLSAIGTPLGEAFQLRDDVLGVFGEAARTGKPVGDDLREGKSTPLLATAIELTDASGRGVLGRLGTPDMSDGDVAQAREILVASGAVDAIEAEITLLVDRARRAIAAAPLSDEAAALLCDLAEYVAWRDS